MCFYVYECVCICAMAHAWISEELLWECALSSQHLKPWALSLSPPLLPIQNGVSFCYLISLPLFFSLLEIHVKPETSFVPVATWVSITGDAMPHS